MQTRSEAPETTELGRQGPSNGLHPAIGQAVRILRTERSWRQEDLAHRARILDLFPAPTLTRGVVSAIETGTRPIDINELVTLCGVFGVTLSELLAKVDDTMAQFGKDDEGRDNFVQVATVTSVLLGQARPNGPTWADMGNLDSRIRRIAKEEVRRGLDRQTQLMVGLITAATADDDD